VVLFTSGSEGLPKAVALSHHSLLANCSQIAARIDLGARDTVLTSLPMFHSFGLTAGTLLPLFCSVKIFLYPSPLHYRRIPETAYENNVTLLSGTNTFLAGYGRFAHPYDFYSVRYVFAGAEKLQEDTPHLGGKIRRAAFGGIWRDGNRSGDGREYADAVPAGQCRPAASGNGVLHRARARHQ